MLVDAQACQHDYCACAKVFPAQSVKADDSESLDDVTDVLMYIGVTIKRSVCETEGLRFGFWFLVWCCSGLFPS